MGVLLLVAGVTGFLCMPFLPCLKSPPSKNHKYFHYLDWGKPVKLLHGLLAIFLLSGCVSNNLVQKVHEGDLTSEFAVVVGSVAKNHNVEPLLGYAMRLDNLDNDGHKYIGVTDPDSWLFRSPEPDFETEYSQGRLFAIPLYAGNHEISNFRLRRINRGRIEFRTARTDFSLPVKIEPNRYNYLGELKLVTVSVPSKLGRRQFPVWLITDEQARDIALLKEKYPEVGVTDPHNAVPDHKRKPTPLVLLPAELDELVEKGVIIELGEALEATEQED
jgi:hypothetical protein